MTLLALPCVGLLSDFKLTASRNESWNNFWKEGASDAIASATLTFQTMQGQCMTLPSADIARRWPTTEILVGGHRHRKCKYILNGISLPLNSNGNPHIFRLCRTRALTPPTLRDVGRSLEIKMSAGKTEAEITVDREKITTCLQLLSPRSWSCPNWLWRCRHCLTLTASQNSRWRSRNRKWN